MSWENPDSVTVIPLLPANGKILQAIVLPLIYAIIHAGLGNMTKLMKRLAYLLQQGVRLMQICIRYISSEQHIQIMRPIAKLAHSYGAKVLVCGNESIALQSQSGADGIHLSASQLMNTSIRPRAQLLSVSCQTQMSSHMLLPYELILYHYHQYIPRQHTQIFPAWAGKNFLT